MVFGCDCKRSILSASDLRGTKYIQVSAAVVMPDTVSNMHIIVSLGRIFDVWR